MRSLRIAADPAGFEKINSVDNPAALASTAILKTLRGIRNDAGLGVSDPEGFAWILQDLL